MAYWRSIRSLYLICMSVSATSTTYTFETVSVDGNGEIVDRRSGAATCVRQNLAAGVDLDLALIPGGSFLMGDERHHPDERPIHQVTLAPFYMSRYPITQVQYRAIMGDGGGFSLGRDYPIEQISWDDAIDFCTRLSQQTGDRYTLPSEAQWEYACRANTNTAFYFGDQIAPNLVNYNGEYPYNGVAKGLNRECTTPVGSFPANAFGLSDMHGNVWEWCLDSYQASYHGAPTDGSAWVDPKASDLKRVMRGGAWDYVARGCRSAVRCSLAPHLRVAGCGLRVVTEQSQYP